LVFLVGIAACGSDGGSTASSPGQGAVDAGVADAAKVLGAGWGPPKEVRYGDTVLIEECGNPTAGLGVPREGLIAHGSSPHLQSFSLSGPDYGDARTSVLVYDDSVSAQRAFEHLGDTSFEDCLVAAVNHYLDADRDPEYPLPEATGDSFDTTSVPFPAGSEAKLIGSLYPEDVFGGFDNDHYVVLFVARSGPVIVTALALVNGQSIEMPLVGATARRLGVSALARATAGS
jgi:hypothetical protein